MGGRPCSPWVPQDGAVGIQASGDTGTFCPQSVRAARMDTDQSTPTSHPGRETPQDEAALVSQSQWGAGQYGGPPSTLPPHATALGPQRQSR